MASPDQLKPTRVSVEAVILATTVLAIVVLALVTGPETPFRDASVVALAILLALLIVAFAGGFARASRFLQDRRTRSAVRQHPELVGRLGAVTVRAKDIFGSSTARLISFLYAAGNVNAGAQRGLGADKATGDIQRWTTASRMQEIMQAWQMETSGWSAPLDAVASLCDGAAKEDTGTFLFALTLLGGFLSSATWAAYRFVDAFRGASHPLDLATKDIWNAFESAANQALHEFQGIVDEANRAFRSDLRPGITKVRSLV